MVIRALGSAVERFVHIEEVTGPIPVVPTMTFKFEVVAVILFLLFAIYFVINYIWPSIKP